MLSKKTRYSLQAMIRLSQEYGKGPILISDISKTENIPQRFLETIMVDLKKLGFLGSRPGKGGGYYLIKKPEEIHVSEIIMGMEGPIAWVPCVSVRFYQPCELCRDEASCKLRQVFREVRENIYKVLAGKTLQDITTDL